MRFIKILSQTMSLALLGISFSAHAIVIEDFESGGFGPSWTFLPLPPVGVETFSAAAAHDGSFGASGASNWYYREDIVINEGDKLSAWFQTNGDGRFYLGFGGDATGASSFVAAPNTEDIRFQNNEDFGFEELNVLDTTFEMNKWYRLEVDFLLGGDIVGNLYDSDGSTLLDSLLAVGVDRTGGGIAVRSFDDIYYDTIEIIRAVEVPSPATLSLLCLALLALTRRHKAGSKKEADFH